MATWLSQYSIVGLREGSVSSPRNAQSHVASLVACVAATYSASVVDSATTGCFFKLHEMACQGLLCIRLYLPSQSRIGQSELTSFGQSRGPIPIPDSIISLDSTRGCQPEQLYSSSDTLGTPQLDL